MKMYKIGEFAELIGVSTTTLRKWDETGELKPSRLSDGGTRYYSELQVYEYTSTINDYFAKVSSDLVRYAKVISNRYASKSERLRSVSLLSTYLDELLTYRELDELTSVYRGTEPLSTTSVNVGYDAIAVRKFINEFYNVFGDDVTNSKEGTVYNDKQLSLVHDIENGDVPKLSTLMVDEFGHLFGEIMDSAESLRQMHAKLVSDGVSDIHAWAVIESDLMSKNDLDLFSDFAYKSELDYKLLQIALVIAKLNFTISDATVSSKIVNDLNVRLSSDINNKLSNG